MRLKLKARIKRVVVNPSVLFHMFAPGTSWEVSKGVPKGSTLQGMTYDPLTQNLNLFVAHEEFPEVDIEHEVSPPLEMLFKRL